MNRRHSYPRSAPEPVESEDLGCAAVLFVAFFVLVFTCGLLIGMLF